MFLELLPCLALLLILSACDAEGDEVRFAGSYEMNVNGDGINETIRGNAFYAEETSEGETFFGIYFVDGDEDFPDEVDPSEGTFGGFIRQGDGNVSTRSYPVADVADAAFELENGEFLLALSTEDQEVYYVSGGGTMTVTSRFSNVIEGTYSVPSFQVLLDSETVAEVTLTGSFEAVNPEEFDGGFFFRPGFDFFFDVPLPF